MAMAQLRALLFDVDGTLAETERDGHRVAFNRAFAEAGLDWVWDEALYGRLLAITGGRERILHYASQYRPQESLPARTLAGLHPRKNELYSLHVHAGRIALRSGLLQLIRDAKAAGLRLGIVTTTSRDNLEALLRACFDDMTREAFDVCIAGEDVMAKKPHPECYEKALAAIGIAADAALAIEDSPNGLRSATAAGLRTLIVRSHYFRDDDFSEAFAVVDEFDGTSLAVLKARFDGILGRE